MSSFTWKGGPGLWSDASNWAVVGGSGSVPGIADDATISTGGNFVVTVAGAQAGHDLTLNASGARLDVTGTLALGGTLGLQAGTLATGGSSLLQGGTFVLEGGVANLGNGSTLAATTWWGTLELPASGTISISDGLSLRDAGGSGPGLLSIPTGTATLMFLNDTTLDNATLDIVSSLSQGETISGTGGTTLTLGADLLLAFAGRQGVPLLLVPTINHGTINVDTLDNLFVQDVENVGSIVLAADGAFHALADMANDGTVIVGTHGWFDVAGNLSGAGSVILGGGSLTVGGTIESGAIIRRGDGTLFVKAEAIAQGVTIDGFAAGSSIDLTGFAFSGNVNAAYSGTPAGGTLTITDGATTLATLFLTGIANGASFSVAADQAGIGSGIAVTTDSPACFAAGTRILTARGEVAVEQLRPGDQAITATGRRAPIAWVGYRHVDCRRHPRKWDIQPVRVAAGAFGPGQPHRDLFLSPDHAVLIAGALIPVRYLVNGRTVAQLQVAEVAYHHVELDTHDVILAEGLPAESYLDTGNRHAFANGGAVAKLDADFARMSWTKQGCAPLITQGRQVAAAKAGLLARAVEMGWQFTDDPLLKATPIFHPGRAAAARPLQARIEGSEWRLRLPVHIHALRLSSRCWVPAHARPDDDDTRTLGVAIAKLCLDGIEIPLEDARMSSGWHKPEQGWRWTAGDATILLPGVRDVSFGIAMAGRYWSRSARTPQAPPAEAA